jgi:putative zinc finger/helix-turn-helix YgiT family protein
MHNKTGDHDRPLEHCLECGSTRLIETIRDQQFTYGASDNAVTLTASMPVISCEACNYEYFDERGEAARHAAVCKHLGVQNPDQIREVRNILGLGRAEFCELGGFGAASLQRWESGAMIPSLSNDRLIYLLKYPENIERLKNRNVTPAVEEPAFATSQERSEPLRETTLVVHTRHATKRFPRLANRTRMATQAANWNLRLR